MPTHRAAFFMDRFRREEKLLGPNEKAAVDYVIALLAAAPKVAAPGYKLVPVSSLGIAGIGRKHFGNPIPQAWYLAAKELLEAASARSKIC